MDNTDLNDGPEPLDNLSLYLAQYQAWGVDITLGDIVDDFEISPEEAAALLDAHEQEERSTPR